jgi:hypothetical protein
MATKAGNIIAAGNIAIIGTTTAAAIIPVGAIGTVGVATTGMLTKAGANADAGLGMDGNGFGPATRISEQPGKPHISIANFTLWRQMI